MPRPCKRRRVCVKPRYVEFLSTESNSKETVNLTVDEFECLRLLDYEQITQEECAKKMNIARTTVTSIYQEARYKLMDAIINGKKVLISGGNYEVCSEHENCMGYNCLTDNMVIKQRKDDIYMRIAVTYDNGQVFQHFGKTQQFKIYDVDESKVIETFILDSNGAGHGALADVLRRNKVDLLICGGIGNGAVNALAKCNVNVCAGTSGDTDQLIEQYLKGELELNGKSNCNHHHEHEEHHECHCGSHEHHHEEKHNCKCH